MAVPAATGRLAAAFQEVFTTAVRIWARRQEVPDGTAFRARLRQALSAARDDAMRAGYAPQDVRLAEFAVVAYLDETILHSRALGLAEWAARPLQEELFGQHLGGEWFFGQLDKLMARPDTPDLLDVLEVYQLCLLLGFRGRYATADHGALQVIEQRVAERLARGRAAPERMAPAWRPPEESWDPRDPAWPRLVRGLVAAGAVAVVLWIAAALLLRAQVNGIRAQALRSVSSSR